MYIWMGYINALHIQCIWMGVGFTLSEYMNGMGKNFRGRAPVPFYMLSYSPFCAGQYTCSFLYIIIQCGYKTLIYSLILSLNVLVSIMQGWFIDRKTTRVIGSIYCIDSYNISYNLLSSVGVGVSYHFLMEITVSTNNTAFTSNVFYSFFEIAVN